MYAPDEDVVAFIASYMNETHDEALRDIATAHGFRADAARIATISSAELVLQVRDEKADWSDAVIAWPAPLRRREDIRRYLQQMQDDARFAG